MGEVGAENASRALVAFLGAIILGESLQGAIGAKYGVRLAEFRALGALQRVGTLPISRFAASLGIGRSTATGLIDRLENAALVERVLDRSDRRMVKVRLTERGDAALRDCALLSEGTIGARIRMLSCAQQAQLAELLEAVIAEEPVPIPSPDLPPGDGSAA